MHLQLFVYLVIGLSFLLLAKMSISHIQGILDKKMKKKKAAELCVTLTSLKRHCDIK